MSKKYGYEHFAGKMKSPVALLVFALVMMLCACAMADVEINETNFPDPFMKWVASIRDTNADGVLSDSESSQVERLEINGVIDGKDGYTRVTVTSTKGLEYFTNLKELTAYGTFEQIDLSRNSKLNKIELSASYVDSVDLSHCPELAEARISIGRMLYGAPTVININKNDKLVKLYVEGWRTKVMDFSGNPLLEELTIEDNTLLETLNISKLGKLKKFEFLSGLPTITSIDFSGNKELEEIRVYNRNIDSVNVSKCSKLVKLDASSNKLAALDVRNNKALKELNASGNQLTGIDLSQNTELRYLILPENQMTSLDISACTNLVEAYKNSEEEYREYFIGINEYTGYKLKDYYFVTDPGVQIITEPGKATPTPTPTPTPEVTPAPTPAATEKTVTVGDGEYSLSGKTATFVRATNKKAKKLTIPDTIKVKGVTYKVTTIDEQACKGMSKLTTVVIGKNVKLIKYGAFINCQKLKSITFKGTAVEKIGTDAVKGIASKATFKCPSKKLKAYKKLLQKAGAPAKAKFTK